MVTVDRYGLTITGGAGTDGLYLISSGTASTSVTTGSGTLIRMVETTNSNDPTEEPRSYDGIDITKSLGPKPTRGRKQYQARLIFSYVKSKLNKLELKKLQNRVSRLQYLLESCNETEQHALKDQLVKEIAIAVRQQEVAACGYDQFVDRKDIERFRGDSATQIDFGKLENFPRLIPDNIRRKIKAVKEKKIFDEFHVLYHNPQKEAVKSTKDKIIEKDPILFGTFAYAPDTFYFIVDWIDELCDLTFEQFVGKLQKVDTDFSVGKVEPLTMEDICLIKQRARTQHDRLRGSNPSNFRANAAQEDAERAGLPKLKETNRSFLNYADSVLKFLRLRKDN